MPSAEAETQDTVMQRMPDERRLVGPVKRQSYHVNPTIRCPSHANALLIPFGVSPREAD